MVGDLVGSTLETVLLGPLLGGRLRYWASDGTARLALVDDEARLGSLMARGSLARSETEPGRFREVALLEAESLTLFAVGRVARTDEESAVADGAQFRLSAAGHPAADAAQWRAAADWWRDAFASAVGRGEFLVVEPGGWEARTEPYALAMARRTDDGAWQSLLEAAPAPRDPLWPASNGPGATIHAPLSAGTLAVAGVLLTQAVRAWAATPFDTVVTFGTNPDGPAQMPPP